MVDDAVEYSENLAQVVAPRRPHERPEEQEEVGMAVDAMSTCRPCADAAPTSLMSAKIRSGAQAAYLDIHLRADAATRDDTHHHSTTTRAARRQRPRCALMRASRAECRKETMRVKKKSGL